MRTINGPFDGTLPSLATLDAQAITSLLPLPALGEASCY